MPARRTALALYFAAEVSLIAASLRYGRGPTIQPMDDAVTLVMLSAWWVAPAPLVSLQKNPTALVATALAMLAASGWCLHSMYTSRSSTIAIGFLTIPVLRSGGLVGLLLVTTALAWLLNSWREHPMHTLRND